METKELESKLLYLILIILYVFTVSTAFAVINGQYLEKVMNIIKGMLYFIVPMLIIFILYNMPYESTIALLAAVFSIFVIFYLLPESSDNGNIMKNMKNIFNRFPRNILSLSRSLLPSKLSSSTVSSSP